MTSAENPFAGRAEAGPRTARRTGALRGQLRAPADKSCSHRALILAALANGTSHITGLLESADVLATARALQQLGARIDRTGPGLWTVTGTGVWTSPSAPLDLGNSGTGVRLLIGAAARFDLTARFVGDSSLSGRPMERVLGPLRSMGATAQAEPGGRLPVTLTGRADLAPLTYTPPIASAQVKSAILLAGLGAGGETVVHEPHATRNHTEVMAPLFGARIKTVREGAGLTARVTGGVALHPCDLEIPGDPSSAAFAVAAALICPGSAVTLQGVMTNPARFGLYEVLRDMQADLELTPAGTRCGEPLTDISVKASRLCGVTVGPERAPSMIDEYPILAVIAAFADGVTHMQGLAELRAKESDRLAASAALLTANGVNVELGEDSLTVHGLGPEGVPGGGLVTTHHDHRLAMAGLVMGLGAQAPVTVDDVAMIATSYPDFFNDLAGLGGQIS